MIPYRAVVEQMAEYFVFVVNADSVTQKKIFIGQQIRDMVVVKSGLEENETIVMDGVQKLKNGAKVKVAAPCITGNRFTGSSESRFIKKKIIVIR